MKSIIFTAPSGSGKTTIVKYIIEHCSELMFSISACTRMQRTYEVNGIDYYFLSVDAFKKNIAEHQFLEWQEVYDNGFYGTLLSEMNRIKQLQKNLIFDIDINGAKDIKQYFGNECLTIFVQPPSYKTLVKRLIERNTESKLTLNHRLEKAKLELKSANDFDIIILNKDLEIAKSQALFLVQQFLK